MHTTAPPENLEAMQVLLVLRKKKAHPPQKISTVPGSRICGVLIRWAPGAQAASYPGMTDWRFPTRHFLPIRIPSIKEETSCAK